MHAHWLTQWIFMILGSRDEGGAWYGFWSGFGGAMPDILILTALLAWWKHKNCHQHRCWRIGRHPVGATGLVTCRKHHPVLGAHGKLTSGTIAALHTGNQQ